LVAKFDMTSTTTPNNPKWKWDHKGFFGAGDSGIVSAAFLDST